MELKSNKRNLDSIRANATKGKYGCDKPPLFNMETYQIIADELHLLLRIMDVLIQALIGTAVAYDHHSTRGIHHRHRTKAQDGPMVQNLVKTIESRELKFYVWEDKQGDGHL